MQEHPIHLERSFLQFTSHSELLSMEDKLQFETAITRI